jgi:hypothetical protein
VKEPITSFVGLDGVFPASMRDGSDVEAVG